MIDEEDLPECRNCAHYWPASANPSPGIEFGLCSCEATSRHIGIPAQFSLATQPDNTCINFEKGTNSDIASISESKTV